MADVITRLKLDSGQFDSKIKRATQGLLQMERECRSMGGTLAVMDKEQKAYVQSLGRMETVSQSARGRINELKQAYTELAVQYKRLTDEEKKGDYGRALSSSLEQLKGRIQSATKELNGVEGEMKGMGGVLSELGSKLGISGDMMGVLTTGTIGMTAAITAGTTAVIAATKAWADYNAELAKQDQITTVTTGLSGADVGTMTDAARSISQVYDVDFREVINAANTLMTQFGQSGDDAIQLIRDGMQGMIQGDGPKLLSMIQQYAPAFQSAGVSAKQLVAVIQNSEGGIFTDQNMNAIVFGIKNIRLMTKATSDALAQVGIDGEQMSKQLNDGTITVFEALKKVAGALQGVNGNSKAAGEVMQAVFGRQGVMAGTNLGKAIAELNTNLEETKLQTGEVGKSFAELEIADNKLNEAMRETFAMDGWTEMENTIKAGLLVQLTSLIEYIGNVSRAFGQLGDTIGGWGNAAKVAVLSIFPPLEGIINLLDVLGGKGGTAFDGLITAVNMALGPVGTLLQALRDIGAAAGVAKGAADKAQIVSTLKGAEGDPRYQGKGWLSRLQDRVERGKNKGTSNNFTPVVAKGTKSGGGGGKTSSAKTSGKPTTAQTLEKAEQDYYNAWMKAAQNMDAGIIKGDEYGKQVNAAQYKLAEAYRKAYEVTDNEAYLATFKKVAAEANTFRDALKADAEQTKEQAEQKKKLKEAEEAYQKAIDSGDYSEIAKTGEALSKLKATATVTGDSKGLEVQDSQNRGARAAYASSNNSMASLGGYISDLQADLKNADLGSAVYDSLMARLQDATMMQGVLTQLMDEGMKGADLQEAANELKTKLLAGDIDEAAWEDFVARVNEKLEEQGFDPIKIDIETGKVSKDIKGTWQDAAKAVESVGSAMSQIEDPAAKVMGTVAQAIASVALGAAEAIKNYKTWQGWDWVAFAATATGTMISTIASIHSATGYAQGGIVDGTQGGFVGGTAYSGDNVGNVRLDSGELVLSRAQQSSLAAELEGNPMKNLRLSTAISGRFLKIAIDNDSRSRNKGKLVTTNQ